MTSVDDQTMADIWTEFSDQQIQQDTLEKKKCCPNPYFIEYEGCSVCVDCGVVGRMGVIDDTPAFCENNQFSHTMTNMFFPKSSGVTGVSGNSSMSRIQQWDSMPYEERVLWEVSNFLKAKLSDIFQTRVVEDSLANFKVLDAKKDDQGKKEIHRGKIRDGLIAACVYFACKSNQVNKTPEEIAGIMGISLTIFNKCTKIYTRLMGQGPEQVSSVDFVESYCNALQITFRVQVLIKKICQTVEVLDLLGGTMPQNITAGCVFFICGELKLDIGIKTLSQAFSISANTMTKVATKITGFKAHIYKHIATNKK